MDTILGMSTVLYLVLAAGGFVYIVIDLFRSES